MGDFNIPLTAMDRSSRQKIKKKTQALNEALDQMDWIESYRTFHPKAAEYTSSQVHMEFALGMITFWATNQALVTLRKWKSYPASFSKHNAIQLEINKKKIAKNHTHTKTWRLNNMLPNNQWIIEEIKEENYSKSSSKREVYSNTSIPQETRESSNKQPNFTSKAAWESVTDKT